MVSDSITNASITSAPNVKDLGKKKRAIRSSAKLKQSKLDVRREQWLAQVKSKGGREDWTGDEEHHNGSNCSTENVEMGRAGAEQNGRGSVHHDSDSESPSNSSISFNSLLGSNYSETNYSDSCSNSSSAGCCSGNITEEDEDGCLDDWEAIADALAANEERSHPPIHPHHEPEPVRRNGPSSGTIRENQRMAPKVAPSEVNHRAWRSDDAFRPQCLPNLSKNHSFPKSSRHCGNGGIPWASRNGNPSPPTVCPICCEDLDMTDSSFLPCLCGFRLCLFCHKRILEEVGESSKERNCSLFLLGCGLIPPWLRLAERETEEEEVPWPGCGNRNP